MTKTNKLTKPVNTQIQTNTPADMIRLAISGGADLDKLEKLLALQERWEANEAKKAYNAAMAAFKANPPKIDKDREVKFETQRAGKVGYKHASLYNVTQKISEALSQHGLSASWTTQQNGNIVVTCRITHEKGHSESTSLSAPSDMSGAKNAIQAIGSTITYLERYTLLALTGLATYEDDDGQASQEIVKTESKPVTGLTPPKAKKPQEQKEAPKTEQERIREINASLKQYREQLGDKDFAHILKKNGCKFENGKTMGIKDIAHAEKILQIMANILLGPEPEVEDVSV